MIGEFALYRGDLTNTRRVGRAKEHAMIAIHRFAKLAGSVAIAAMMFPAYSLAEFVWWGGRGCRWRLPFGYRRRLRRGENAFAWRTPATVLASRRARRLTERNGDTAA